MTSNDTFIMYEDAKGVSDCEPCDLDFDKPFFDEEENLQLAEEELIVGSGRLDRKRNSTFTRLLRVLSLKPSDRFLQAGVSTVKANGNSEETW